MIDSRQDEENIGFFVVRNAAYYRDNWKKFQELSEAIFTRAMLVCIRPETR